MKRWIWGFTALGLATGCEHVAPYQREALAHPSMRASSYVGPAEQHVRSVQEGAIGGQLDAAIGCGCN
jgi:hypothetical protein